MRPTTPYHLVTLSPWPIFASLACGFITMALVGWFHQISYALPYLLMSLAFLLLILSQWWTDVIREATYQGAHTRIVQKNIRFGMILFIISEAMFFVSFFWAFLHSSLASTVQIGCIWPPKGIDTINPFALPLLNTALLLSSGVTLTWAHKELCQGNYKYTTIALAITLIYGATFTLIQLIEYKQAPFAINSGIYGSTFFVSTGFHGLHVIIGAIFIAVCLWRNTQFHFTSSHHVGFECATWYWHFVDVVWIALYLVIYWWGS